MGLFVLGFALRQRGYLQARHAGMLFAVVVNVGLPALMLGTLSREPLQAEFALLPLFAAAMVVGGLLVSWTAGRMLRLPRASHGAFTACAASLNIGFEYPFVLAGWGSAAFAQLAIFDVGNAVMHMTVLYMAAAAMGGHRTNLQAALRRTAQFPPLWGLTAALIINLMRIPVPGLLLDGLLRTGQVLMLAVVFALGILLEPRHLLGRAVLALVGLRFTMGIVGGLIAVTLLDVYGLQRHIMLVGAAAPVAFSTVAIAQREHLDVELATAAASLSALLGVVLLPIALLALR